MVTKQRMTLLLGTGLAVLTVGFSLGVRPAAAVATTFPTSQFARPLFDQDGGHGRDRGQQHNRGRSQWNGNYGQWNRGNQRRDRDDQNGNGNNSFWNNGGRSSDRDDHRGNRDQHKDRDDHRGNQGRHDDRHDNRG